MRLAVFQHQQKPTLGIVREPGILPVPNVSLREVLENSLALDLLKGMAGEALPLHQVELFAPLPLPYRPILCVGLNYAEHVHEFSRPGRKLPEAPVFFTKAPGAVNGPYSGIPFDPAASTQLDWEVELGVIIGRRGKNIREEDAFQHVFGYTIVNDVSARDLQARHQQFFKGKSLDGTCPVGPWIVTADEIPEPQNLTLHCRVNGVVKQDGNSRDMIFRIPRLIAELSRGMTLEPGDVISTGTPSGVGFSRTPPEFLKPGDVVECEIEGIGTIRNTVG
ncbi:MAG TPA: 5-carboxymethyl-2-hydroxymuconate isomerase [Fibrobacteres bacterium]|nr:5-carboxymethyl-2-hydroxymuconate isomerase [Fibrobacterota bacterium]